MKTTLFTLFVLFFSFGNSQNSTFFTQKTVTLEGVSKDELFYRAKLWSVMQFTSPLDVTLFDNTERNSFIVSSSFPVMAQAGLMSRQEEGKVNYRLSIQFKDNSYTYTIEKFTHECHKGYGSGGDLNSEKPACPPASLPLKGWVDIKGQADAYSKKLQDIIEEAMAKKS